MGLLRLIFLFRKEEMTMEKATTTNFEAIFKDDL